MNFTGYTPETIDFLWGIRMNNDRDWFLAHKPQYVKTLYEPTKALGHDLFEPFLQKPGNILKVSRIYRDTRLKPAVPYKESLWICIRQEAEWWSEKPCLFFEIRPEGVDFGFCLWKPKPAAMEAFRRHIAGNPREFLEVLRKTEQAAGMAVTANPYKRPKPCGDPALAPYMSWKDQISCIRHLDASPGIFGPALEEEVRRLFAQLTPIYEYFNLVLAE